MQSEKIFSEIRAKLLEAESWGIICHENPDGDTLGSALALYSFGKRLGKNVFITGRDLFPDRYSFMPFSDEYRQFTEEIQVEPDRLLISVDVSTEARGLPELTRQTNNSICIDHHGDNPGFMSLNLIRPDASATAELVCKIICESDENHVLTNDEASLLYVALVTDNGNFRFSSTTAASHECAAQLLSFGADPSALDNAIRENLTVEALSLWGIVISRARTFCDGKAGMFWLTAEDLERCHADHSAFDGIVNMLMRIKGLKIAVYAYDECNGTVKLSIRTKAEYSARVIANCFGGGGHERAAGAKNNGTLRETLLAVEKVVCSICS